MGWLNTFLSNQEILLTTQWIYSFQKAITQDKVWFPIMDKNINGYKKMNIMSGFFVIMMK